MKFRVIYHPEVINDLKIAIDWYEGKKAGLGNKFLLTVRKQLTSLQTSALHYAVKYDDVRCMPVKKFPYMVHFRVNQDENTVKVEAVFNTWISPANWSERVKF